MVVVIICIKTSKLATVLLPAAVETHRLGSGLSDRAGAAHGAAAPHLAPRTFKLPGLPSSPPTHTHTHTRARTHTRNKPVCQPSLRPLSIQVSPWSAPRCVFRLLQVNKKRIFIFLKKKKKKSTVFPLYPFKGAFSLLQVIPKRGCASERNEFSPPLAKTHDFSQRTALTPLATIALVSLGMLDKLDIRSR